MTFQDVYSFDLVLPKKYNVKQIENFLTFQLVEIDGELVNVGIDKPAKKGRDLYDSFNTTLCEFCVFEDKVIFSANVEASLNCEVYYPQVCIDMNDGKITISMCTCEASPTGTCTHVSCLLHAILDISKDKEPKIARPCTSKVIIYSLVIRSDLRGHP